jgi:hypothetical protein
MTRNSNESDPKGRATAAIWGCAVGMFGICIPLVATFGSSVLALPG